MEATEKALSINPEHYSFWNFRKRIFLQKFKRFGFICFTLKSFLFFCKFIINSSEIETEILHKECTKELEFIVTCIQRHPKSYWVWHQRLWLIEKSLISSFNIFFLIYLFHFLIDILFFFKK